tara:strand:- start:40 stop:381 length:342 start_codon:yes stop_codon:yes gene_type:complete
MIYDSKTKQMQIILRNELQQAKLMRKHKKDLANVHKGLKKDLANVNKGNGYLILRGLCLIIIFLSAFVGTLMFITDWEWQQHICYAIGTFAWFVCVPAFSLAFGYSFVMQGME